MSNPIRKKVKLMTPTAYIADDAWSIIKQFLVDYSFSHKSKMIHVLGELRNSWASIIARREYYLGTDGSLLCVRWLRALESSD